MVTSSTIGTARRLRRHLTPPEVRLWQALRRQAAGLKVRRQHPFGPYVLDFYVASAKLAVEIDGKAHDFGDRPERDGERDDWLLERGVRTLRIASSDVMADLDAVVRLIVDNCSITPPPPPAAAVPLPICDGEELVSPRSTIRTHSA